MLDTERTRLPWPDPMSTHFDLQPAIAAGCTASTGSLILRFHRTGQPPRSFIRLRSALADLKLPHVTGAVFGDILTSVPGHSLQKWVVRDMSDLPRDIANPITASADLIAHIARVRVNYRFGGPLVAKY
jgi:hypothetical protein